VVAKWIIINLTEPLDETKEWKQSQIYAKIKEMLADKIKEGKITKSGLSVLYHKNIGEDMLKANFVRFQVKPRIWKNYDC
jgi:hypothetical protein